MADRQPDETGRAVEPAENWASSLIDLSPVAALVTSLDGTIRFWSESAQNLFGYSRAEAVGRVYDSLLRTRPRVPVSERCAVLRRTGRWQGELRHIARDGRTVTAVARRMLRGRAGSDEEVILETQEDITRLRDAEEAYKGCKAVYYGAVEALSDHIAIIDQTGLIIAVNHAWRRFAAENGAAGDPAVGPGSNYLDVCRLSAQNDTHAGPALAGIRSVLAGETDFFHMKYPCHSPVEHRWFLMTVVPFGSGAHRGAVVSHFNVTESEQRELQSKLLLREVNHRSRNMLALIQVIASQTAAADLPAFQKQFLERLQALAASQDLLVRSQWQNIDLHDLLRSQLAPFDRMIGDRIVVSGPRLWLAASAAQSIGMALHELATNSGKYGALSVQSGRVEIAWRVDRRPSGEDCFSIAWREAAGPHVQPPRRRGFGSAVIEDAPRMELEANVDLEYAPDGFCWRLQCPAERIWSSGKG